MKVVVVGSGAREHALASVLGRAAEVVVTPGNPGIPGSTSTSVEELVAAGDIGLVVVGPEQPLVDGLADRLRDQGILVFGPGADGAQLEGSKSFMKDVVQAAGVPTASYKVYSASDYKRAQRQAQVFIKLYGSVAIKTVGLAAGKGVLVTSNLDEACRDITAKLSGQSFGEAGTRIIVEAGMTGPEVSVFAICDGERSICLPAAQDFKRQLDGDQGPNTGGMGAWSPLPFLLEGFEEDINQRFIQPTLAELRRRGIDYRGVLYAGLMLTPEGPKLVEYNIRFGDPDSQVVLLRMESSLLDLLLAAAKGNIRHFLDFPPTFYDTSAVLTVMAAEGYPTQPRTGDVIQGLKESLFTDGAEVLYAGVGQNQKGQLITTSGRVLNVVGYGKTTEVARANCMAGVSSITWPGEQHRTDIAQEA